MSNKEIAILNDEELTDLEKEWEIDAEKNRLRTLKEIDLVSKKGKVYQMPFDSEPIPDGYKGEGVYFFFQPEFKADSPFIKGWESRYRYYLNSIPAQYVPILLLKGIEYGRLMLDFHQQHERLQLICVRSWERRIKIAENIQKEIAHTEHPQHEDEGQKGFSKRAQIFAHNLYTVEKGKTGEFRNGHQWWLMNKQKGNWKKVFPTTDKNQKSKYRPPTNKELNEIIQILTGIEFQKFAINDLAVSQK